MRSSWKKGISFLLVFTLLISMIGFVSSDSAYAATNKTHLRKTEVTVVAGKTYQQRLITKSGKTITATKVTWKSSKTSVAKINKKGKITAVKPGTAKMTAKYKGKTYKFTVTVKKGAKEKKANKVYAYIRDNGSSLKSKYEMPGDYCITSGPVTRTVNGKTAKDTYIISVKSGNKYILYFGMYREYINSDTREYARIVYNARKSSGKAAFSQLWFLNGKGTLYIAEGKMKFSAYNGEGFVDDATGLSNLTVGSDNERVDDPWYVSDLFEAMSDTTRNVNKLLNKKLNFGLRDLGFKKF